MHRSFSKGLASRRRVDILVSFILNCCLEHYIVTIANATDNLFLAENTQYGLCHRNCGILIYLDEIYKFKYKYM